MGYGFLPYPKKNRFDEIHVPKKTDLSKSCTKKTDRFFTLYQKKLMIWTVVFYPVPKKTDPVFYPVPKKTDSVFYLILKKTLMVF